MLKIGFALDGFRPEMVALEVALDRIAQVGFEYCEPALTVGQEIMQATGFSPYCSFDEDPRAARRAIESRGLKASAVATHTNLMGPFGITYGAATLRKAIRFAAEIGAPCVNTSEGATKARDPRHSDEECFQQIRWVLDAALRTAEEYGVYIGIEPHGPFSTTVGGMKRIMSLVDSPWLGINYDTGNVLISGHDPVATLKELVGWVRHVHLKDVIYSEPKPGHEHGTPMGTGIGMGNVDLKACIEVLEQGGYDGVLAAETEAKYIVESYQCMKALVEHRV